MLIKITDRCSMGCNHCLSDCTPDLRDMDLGTFASAIAFYDKYCRDTCKPIIISGGEPFESNIIMDILRYLIHFKYTEIPIIITTNGLWLTKDEQLVRNMESSLPNCSFQIVVDDRYYPEHINENSPIFNYKNVTLCRDVMAIYPQGRALDNNLPYQTKASKCFNIRAITKQMKGSSLSEIFRVMTLNGKFCTPHIDIDGYIKLGESRLCPVCSSIHLPEERIIDDIINFQCHQCDFINDKLPSVYKQFVE